MLAEAALFAATLAVSPTKNAGAIHYSVKLWSRAHRCRAAWLEHETRTKDFILKKMATLERRRTAVVLGSGLLRDVPIRQLADAFDRVILYDIAHLASVRLTLKIGKYRNVMCVERDVSGYDALKHDRDLRPLAFLEKIADLDFIVSPNLLSQLGTGAEHRLKKEHEPMPEDTVARILAAHWQGLTALPAAACLVTDVSYAVIDRAGKTLSEVDLMHGVALPPAEDSWLWPVSPFGEESREHEFVHRVIAV
jgi:hypothetical protein